MKKLFLILLAALLVLPGWQAFAQDEAVVTRLEEYGSNLPAEYGLLDTEQLSVLLIEQDVVLLDVREPEEYEAGHVEDSFNVPVNLLVDNLNLLPDLDATIVVICKGGARAALAASSLHVLGYDNTKILKGGYDAWVGAELPVVTEPFVPDTAVAPEIDPVVLEAVDNFITGINKDTGYGLISAQNLNVELAEDAPLLIDVRSAKELETTGYIEGAQHLWINEFFARQDEWPAEKDAKIVIYCASGYRGAIGKIMMQLMGYTNVRNLSGGLNGWIKSEFPVVGKPFDAAAALPAYIATLPENFNAVRPADLKTELDGGAELLLVDVRTVDEYAEGYIAGAVNIPINELTMHLDMLPDLEQNIVVYCGSGHRSALAMTSLNLLGYKNVRSMISGIGGWTGAEYELSQEPVEAVVASAPQVDAAALKAVEGFMTTLPAGYYTVKPADLNVELMDAAPILIDVRTDGEWADGYIEGAVHIPFASLLTDMTLLPQDKTAAIVIYDNPTHRSSMAMMFLKLLGYENVRALGGGFGAWSKAELPVAKDS